MIDEMASFEYNLNNIVDAIVRNELIPFLGTGVSLIEGRSESPWQIGKNLPSDAELAEYLAELSIYPREEPLELMHVAQRYADVAGLRTLYDRLDDIYLADHRPNRLHYFLTALPALLRQKGFKASYPLIATTNYDDLLEQAFHEQNVPFDLLIYPSTFSAGGKFIHLPFDAEPILIESPSKYDGIPLSEMGLERPVVLKLRGGVVRSYPELTSFAITEDDYASFGPMNHALPPTIIEILKTKSFAFLGCSSRDSGLRSILTRILSNYIVDYASWTVQPNPSWTESTFWEKRKIQLLDTNLEDFIDELELSLQLLPAQKSQTTSDAKDHPSNDKLALETQIPIGLEYLVRALSSTSHTEQLDAIKKLGATRNPTVLRLLLEKLAHVSNRRKPTGRQRREDAEVRQAIAAALSKFQEQQALDALISLSSDNDPKVRLAATEALGKRATPQAVDALFDMLRDDELGNRWVAAREIARITGPEEGGLLIELLRDRQENRSIEDAVIRALRKIRDPHTDALLEELLNNRRPMIRQAAVQALGRVRGDQSFELLLNLIKRNNSVIREAATDALGQRGDSRAVESLTKALKDKEKRVSDAARRALRRLTEAAATADKKEQPKHVTPMQNAYALLIGISGYPDHYLIGADKDARYLYETLTDSDYCGYLKENVSLLLNEQATRAKILASLDDLARRTDETATLIFYFSGTGRSVEASSDTSVSLAILPIDAKFEQERLETWITDSELAAAILAIPSQRTLVVLDCSHSGGFRAHPRISLLASSRADEESMNTPEGGAFTVQLLNALRGGISSNDGFIHLLDLFNYIQPRVTGEFPNQHPVLRIATTENFPLALYLGGPKRNISVDEQGFLYDVFLAYPKQAQNSAWILSQLLPQIEEAGLRVVSSDIEEVNRGIITHTLLAQTKRVLLVLSADSSPEPLTRFSKVLDSIADLDGRRVLLLVTATVEPNDLLASLPDRLQNAKRIEANLGNPHSLSTTVNNLIMELKQLLPPKEISDFGVRKWALRRISDWLGAGEPSFLLLIGVPGSGKTSTVQSLIDINRGGIAGESYPHLWPGGVAAYHIARLSDASSLGAVHLFENLATQLATRFPGFAAALVDAARGSQFRVSGYITPQGSSGITGVTIENMESVNSTSPEDAFRLLLKHPLEQLYDGGFNEHIFIVVDALDELLGYDRELNPFLKLQGMLKTLPPRVRFLITSRPTSLVLDLSRIALDVDTLLLDIDDFRMIEKSLQRLSASAKEAFLWAEGLRGAKGARELYSTYLLAGLYQDVNGTTRKLLTIFNEHPEIHSRLKQLIERTTDLLVGMETVRSAEPDSLNAIPLSGNTEKALKHAVALISAGEAASSLHAHHLLLGLLSAESQAAKWIAETLEIPRETIYKVLADNPDSLDSINEVWRASQRRPLFLPLRGHRGAISSLDFSPEQGWLCSASADLTVRMWDVAKGTSLRSFEGHTTPILSGRCSPDGALLLTAAEDGTLLVWDIREGQVLATIDGLEFEAGAHNSNYPNTAQVMAITPNSKLVVFASLDRALKVCALPSGTELSAMHGHAAPVTALAITPDGHRCLSATQDGELKVWDLRRSVALLIINDQAAGGTALALVQKGEKAILGLNDGTLKAYDLSSSEALFIMPAHKAAVRALAVVEDGRQIISASTANDLVVWDWETKKRLSLDIEGAISALAVSPDGRSLAVGLTDGEIRLLDLPGILASLEAAPWRDYVMELILTASEVAVGQRVQLTVNLVPAPPGRHTFELPNAELELHCFVSTDDLGLRIEGAEVCPITLDPQTGQPSAVTFDLHAYLRGERSCHVQIFTEDHISGRTQIFESPPVTINVTPPRPEESRPSILPEIELRVAPQPDFILQVETDWPQESKRQRLLTYRVTSHLLGLHKRKAEAGSVTLREVDLTRLPNLLAAAFGSANGQQPEDIRERMLSFGAYLFDMFFPLDTAASFREIFSQASEQLKTWLVIEDGLTWVPWELMVSPVSDKSVSPRFLGECFQLSRWVNGLGPLLYSEVPLGEVALAHYLPLALGEENEELHAWNRVLKALSVSGISEVIRPETPFYGLHLLRYNDSDRESREIVARASASGPLSSMEDAKRARLSLRLKRPVVALSILSRDGNDSEVADDWPLPDRVMPFLRAGASAVIGPWWPTSEAADRVFWMTFYDLLSRRVPLGEVVWRARLAVERAYPDRPDWLVYTLFGDPRARAYWPEHSEGYTTLERLSSNKPLKVGQPCYFRATISSRPPVLYQDRLVQTEQLPQEPMALFLAPGLQEFTPEPVRMSPCGRSTVQATYQVTPRQSGEFFIIARLFDGEERLQSLRLSFVVEHPFEQGAAAAK